MSLWILDPWGFGDLSIWRVADELGVKAGALYCRVPNRQSLLAGITDVMLTPVVVPDTTGADKWPRDWSRSLCEALLAHRGGAELVASTTTLGMDTVNATAAARGVPTERACLEPEAAAVAFLHFILGHVMAEQAHTQLVSLGVLNAFDDDVSGADFNHGAELLVRGVTT